MIDLEADIKQAKYELHQLLSQIPKPVKTKESIRALQTRGHFCYYLRSPENKYGLDGQYLPKNKHYLASKLLQNEYNSIMIESITQQINQLQTFIDGFDSHKLERPYYNLHPAKKAMVKPYVISDEDYLRQWEMREYEPNPYPFSECEYYTAKGEQVRSKSEVIIADRLFHAHIPYHYEAPYVCTSGKLFYPDFEVLNTRTRQTYYWEHFGIMDDPDYAASSIQKLNSYCNEGICPGHGLIITYETSQIPLNVRQIALNIQTFLQ